MKDRSPILVIVLVLVAAFGVAAQARITIAPESAVDGETIELQNIAKIAADTRTAERLRTISLGYSPGVGMTREISISGLMLSLKAAGFAESDISISAPARISVRRAAQTVDRDAIRDAVAAAINAHFVGSKTEHEITRIDIFEPALIPTGKIDLRASLVGVRNFIERIPVSVEIRVDGRLVRTMAVSAEIAIYADVYVAINDIQANKPVSDKDLRLERIRLERSPSSYVRDASALRSVQAIRPIMAGRPLMLDSIEPATVIKLGDPVRIEARSGRIRIVVEGEARANGRIGERISVKNKQSGALIQAIVVDHGFVKVNI